MTSGDWVFFQFTSHFKNWDDAANIRLSIVDGSTELITSLPDMIVYKEEGLISF
jgi:hypothetical protein